MKLRIKGNSVRMRLTKTEIDRFAAEGYLEDRTDFGSNNFVYALRSDPSATEIAADLAENKITVRVPADISARWTGTDVVGFDNNYQAGPGKKLYLLIEKDFKCIDNTSEDQSDNYENPNSVCN